VYGVNRDDAPAGAERPFGDLCIRRFIMHANMEYTQIIMTGACSYEGKTFKAIASSRPGSHVQVIHTYSACVIKQYNLVPYKGRRCSVARHGGKNDHSIAKCVALRCVVKRSSSSSFSLSILLPSTTSSLFHSVLKPSLTLFTNPFYVDCIYVTHLTTSQTLTPRFSIYSFSCNLL